MSRIITAASIFEIRPDTNMINEAMNAFKQLDNVKDAYYKYKISPAFFYLAKFKNTQVDNIINEFASNKEYLISHNAKQALSNRD